MFLRAILSLQKNPSPIYKHDNLVLLYISLYNLSACVWHWFIYRIEGWKIISVTQIQPTKIIAIIFRNVPEQMMLIPFIDIAKTTLAYLCEINKNKNIAEQMYSFIFDNKQFLPLAYHCYYYPLKQPQKVILRIIELLCCCRENK